jgi:hypothetical protein
MCLNSSLQIKNVVVKVSQGMEVTCVHLQRERHFFPRLMSCMSLTKWISMNKPHLLKIKCALNIPFTLARYYYEKFPYKIQRISSRGFSWHVLLLAGDQVHAKNILTFTSMLGASPVNFANRCCPAAFRSPMKKLHKHGRQRCPSETVLYPFWYSFTVMNGQARADSRCMQLLSLTQIETESTPTLRQSSGEETWLSSSRE